MTAEPARRLWFDDIRQPPDDTWLWARTVGHAKELLTEAWFDECSLDHDMGLHELDPGEGEDWDKIIEIANALAPRHEENGFDLVEWMIETGEVPARVTIHSWNRPAAVRMAARLNRAGYDVLISPFQMPAGER